MPTFTALPSVQAGPYTDLLFLPGPYIFTAMQATIATLGFSIHEATAELTPGVLGQSGVMVMPVYHTLDKLSPTEVSTITRWLQSGGSLLILYCDSAEGFSNVNAMLSPYNAKLDAKGQIRVAGSTTNVESHAITDGVDQVSVAGGGGFNARILPVSVTADGGWVVLYKGTEAMSNSIYPQSAPLAAALDLGETRMAVFGDGCAFGDQLIDNDDNLLMLRNTLTWLAHR